jgi:hypothetical protein
MFQKYLIFLPKKYFMNSFFNLIYIKIKKRLKNKGINVCCYNNYLKKLNNNEQIFLFDDNIYPQMYLLYIYLSNNNYYNDNIYSKKKNEIERNALILLAGKLGIKSFIYSIYINEISYSQISTGCNILNNLIKYNKNSQIYDGESGIENYINKGAPVYLLSKNINNVEEYIKNMDSNIFSYDFYKSNIKLQTFVYKRYELNMLEMEYNIEFDDISEISIIVKTCFIKYGINISIENHKIYHEIIKCKFNFYTDNELKLYK